MKNNKLTENQELNYINTINNLLKNYENCIKLINEKSDFPQIIDNGSEITKLMLEILLKKEGYSIRKNIPIIKYAVSTNLIPNEYIKPLLKINRIENIAKYPDKITDAHVHDFLNKFKCFISWFDEIYAFKNKNHVFKIKNCCDLITQVTKKEKINNQTPLITGSDPTYISKVDELLGIHEINNIIRKLEKHIELISEDNYGGSVIEGHKLCVSMLELYLKKERYNVENHQVLLNDKKMLIIPFCTLNDIFPKECQRFLNSIKKYRNEFVHLKPSYELATSFLSALSYFMIWFNNFYSEKFNIEKPFKIEKCYNKINSLTKNKSQKVMNEKILMEVTNYNILQDLNSYDLELKRVNPLNRHFNIFDAPNDLIIKQLYQKTVKIENKLDELEKISKKIETKLDELYKGLSSQITSYQSLIEKQLKKTSTPEDLDMIIEGYVDECVERITEHNEKISEEKSYKIEKKKLIRSFGENAWNKLSENSKTFLISSKLMYNNLILIDDVDYSGVCVLITKALEVEISKRFFINFIKYLDKTYNKDYSQYHTALLHKNKTPLYFDKFTMGRIAFILCYFENRYDNKEQIKNNKEKLMEYCKSCIFSNYENAKIEDLLERYASSIEDIRVKYRNRSAHVDEIKQIDAEECMDLVLDVEKLLKQMLDSFDQ